MGTDTPRRPAQAPKRLEGVGHAPRLSFPALFTKGRVEVPKQDGTKFTLLPRIGSAIPARRPERIAPFILTEAARVAAFFLTLALGPCAESPDDRPAPFVRHQPVLQCSAPFGWGRESKNETN